MRRPAPILLTALVVGSLFALSFADDAVWTIRFVDRAAANGVTIKTTNGTPAMNYIIDTLGGGVALFDFDGDGDLDLYIVNGSSLDPIPQDRRPVAALYQNDGHGKFKEITAGSGLAVPFWGFGAATGDYDNDGDTDLYVTSWGPNHLFRNDGGGHFTDVAHEAGVDADKFGTSAAFLDYDADGALDLFVANYVTFDPAKVPSKGDPNQPCQFRGLNVQCGPHGLPGAVDILYHNNGDGTFTDATAQAGLFMEGTYYGLGVIATDINDDGLSDILVANDSTPNHYYRNLGNGTFVDDAMMSGFAYSNDGREQAGMGIDSADIDGDLDRDVFITNFSHDYSTLRLNQSSGLLEDVTLSVGLVEATIRTLGWGTHLFDMENDGDTDIFIANGHVYPEVDQADIGTTWLQHNQIFENLGNLKFRELLSDQVDALKLTNVHRGAARGDIDGDGDIDLIVTVLDGVPELLVNESTAGAWLRVSLAGHQSNRDGVGARVTVTTPGGTWVKERSGGSSYLSASEPVVHFGLGAARRVDSVTVRWPSGITQTIPRPRINATLRIEETASSAPPDIRSTKP